MQARKLDFPVFPDLVENFIEIKYNHANFLYCKHCKENLQVSRKANINHALIQ